MQPCEASQKKSFSLHLLSYLVYTVQTVYSSILLLQSKQGRVRRWFWTVETWAALSSSLVIEWHNLRCPPAGGSCVVESLKISFSLHTLTQNLPSPPVLQWNFCAALSLETQLNLTSYCNLVAFDNNLSHSRAISGHYSITMNVHTCLVNHPLKVAIAVSLCRRLASTCSGVHAGPTGAY